MEIGIFSRTYPDKEAAATFARMTGHGIYATQLNLSNAGMPSYPDAPDETGLSRLAEAARGTGIRMDALSGTFNMIDPDKEARRRGARQFRTQCQIAARLRIPIVSLCTGSKHPTDKWTWHEDNNLPGSWDDLMETTGELLSYAEEFDVILGVETEASNIVNSARRARRYLDEAGSPRLKIIMDGANLFLPSQLSDMHRILDEAFDLLGSDIVLAHAKDLAADGASFVAAGEGILDYRYYLAKLARCGYDGPLMMHGLSPSQVPVSRDFLLHTLKELHIGTKEA